MEVPCLQDQLSTLSAKDQSIRVNIFQELIFKRLVFTSRFSYVHISGGLLVYSVGIFVWTKTDEVSNT